MVNFSKISPLAMVNYKALSPNDQFKEPSAPRMSAPISFLTYRSYLLVVALLIFAFFGTESANAQVKVNTRNNSPDCACKYNETVDYFPVKVAPHFSNQWSVTYHRSYKKLTVKTAKGDKVYYLYLCGTPLPQAALSDPKAKAIEIPVRSVALKSTTYIPFFEYLGARDVIFYVQSTRAALSNCMLKLVDEKLTEVIDPEDDYYGTDLDDVAKFNKSAYDRTGAVLDLFLEDQGGFSDVETNIVNNFLKNNATKVLSMAETKESNPVGAIEWLEVLSLVMNRERVAKKIVELIDARYQCVAQKATQATVGLAKKKVLYISFYSATFGGYFGAPACEGNYWCTLVTQAGAELITFPNGVTTNHSLFVEQYAKQADFVLYADFNWNTVHPLYAFLGTFYVGEAKAAWSNVPAVVNNRVFDVRKVHWSLYFEDRLAQPDLMLMDMTQMIYGDQTFPTRSRYFLRRVFTEPVENLGGDAKKCVDPTAPRYSGWLSGPCAVAVPDDFSPDEAIEYRAETYSCVSTNNNNIGNKAGSGNVQSCQYSLLVLVTCAVTMMFPY